MNKFRLFAAVVFLFAIVSCIRETLPTETKIIDFVPGVETPVGFENWPRTVFVFDKDKCVEIVNAQGASDMKVNVGAGYQVVAIAYSTAENLSITPSEAGHENFRYKLMAEDFNKPLPRIWYGSTTSKGDGNLQIAFSPLTSEINLEFNDVPSDLDSVCFDLPVSYDAWYPCEQKAEVSLPGSARKHIVLDTRGKNTVSLNIGTMAMMDAQSECYVPVSCYYKDRYTSGYLPFTRRVGEAQNFNLTVRDACGQMFDSPFSISYELSELATSEPLHSGNDYLSQWEYSYEPLTLPKDTTAFFVRNGQRMMAGRSFAFQFGSIDSGFYDSQTEFHINSDYFVKGAPIYAANGFDHIRIPIDEGWCFFSNGEAKPKFKQEVIRLVDAILATGMRVIIDYHWMSSGIHVMPSKTAKYPALLSEQEIRFRNTWRQLHELFKDYAPEDLAYEIVNESYTGGDYDWNEFLERAIHMMRSWGGNELRRVIFCPCESEGDAAIAHMVNMKLPRTDPNLVISFHDYSPDWFCFHDTSENTKYGGPIHYPGRLILDSDLEALKDSHPDWYQTGLWFCLDSWDKSRLQNRFREAAELAKKIGYPIWLGEYGATVQAPYNDRVKFYQDLCSSLRDLGIAYSFWFEICKEPYEDVLSPDEAIMRAMVPLAKD